MALIAHPKNRRWLAITACLILVISFSLALRRPILAAIYKWKEPYFIMPVHLEDNKLVIRRDDWGEGHFGAKRKGGRLHKGIDIAAEKGTPVYAAKSGIAVCGYEPRGMGKYVKIVHPGGYSSIYGHMDDWLMRPRCWVSQGKLIGLVGKSGNADIDAMRAHLHFEVRDGESRAVDPLAGYLRY